MAWLRGCPGATRSKEVRPEDIDCPFCGAEVEIWSHEQVAECPECGHKVTRSLGASCIDWCAHARECVGREEYERRMRMLENTTDKEETDA